MANFNEKINCGIGHVLPIPEYFIYRSDSTRIFEQLIDPYLYFRKNAYRLCIQYKDTHPVKNVAGRCFMWNCASATSNSVEGRILNCDNNEDFSSFGYFGDPTFDSIAGAIFIIDEGVVTYGDTWIEAVEISGEHVVCNTYVCGLFVSEFRIPAETFDRLFGLKENFPKQYEKVFGKTEEAKPVQEKNDLIEEAKRTVELCKNLLYLTKQVIDRSVELVQDAIIEIEDRSDQSVELILGALIDIEGWRRELDDTIDKLT